MSDNIKNEIFIIIIFEKLRQTLKVCNFHLCKTIQAILYAMEIQDRPTFGALSKPSFLSLVFGYKHNLKFFRN